MAKNEETIKIKIDGERWEKALDNSFKKAQATVSVDGFRKGHVPKDVFLKKYGLESLFEEAVHDCIDEAYQSGLKKSKIKPVIEPGLNISEINKDGVTFEIKIIGKPEVTLGEYKNLKIKMDKVEVTQKEIDERIKELRDKYAEIKIKDDDTVANGDIAIIDFDGIVDGKKLDGGSAKNYELEIGSHSFIPGFEEALIGMKSETTKDINLKFPENYVKDLAGKDVTFTVTVHEVKERVLPKLDKDFFEDLGMENVTNKEELEKETKKVLEDEKKNNAEDKKLDEIMNKATLNLKVEIPDEILHDEIHRLIHNMEHELSHNNMTLDQYLKMLNITEEDLHKQLEPEATSRIKSRYLLEEVAEKENITVTKEEVDKDIEEMSKNYGISKEDLINSYGGREVLEYDSKMRKTLNFLKDNN